MSNFINKIMDDIFDKLIFFLFFALMLCALFGGIHCFASLFVNFPIIIQIEQQKDYNSQPIFSISAQKQLLSSHNSYSTSILFVLTNIYPNVIIKIILIYLKTQQLMIYNYSLLFRWYLWVFITILSKERRAMSNWL